MPEWSALGRRWRTVPEMTKKVAGRQHNTPNLGAIALKSPEVAAKW
jgi:hypothetical protein